MSLLTEISTFGWFGDHNLLSVSTFGWFGDFLSETKIYTQLHPLGVSGQRYGLFDKGGATPVGYFVAFAGAGFIQRADYGAAGP